MRFKLEPPYYNYPMNNIFDVVDYCIEYFFYNLVEFGFYIFGK